MLWCLWLYVNLNAKPVVRDAVFLRISPPKNTRHTLSLRSLTTQRRHYITSVKIMITTEQEAICVKTKHIEQNYKLVSLLYNI